VRKSSQLQAVAERPAIHWEGLRQQCSAIFVLFSGHVGGRGDREDDDGIVNDDGGDGGDQEDDDGDQNDKKRRRFPKTFEQQYLAAGKRSAPKQLGKWVLRFLHRARFSIRKKTASQTVPANWRALAETAATDIRQAAVDFGATHVVNADQTLMRFFPKAAMVAAPTGVKRVGSIVKTAPKDGCTLMVTAEFGTGKLLKPFLVMDGVTGATLDKKYASWH
jgi:hypothetical protein